MLPEGGEELKSSKWSIDIFRSPTCIMLSMVHGCSIRKLKLMRSMYRDSSRAPWAARRDCRDGNVDGQDWVRDE